MEKKFRLLCNILLYQILSSTPFIFRCNIYIYQIVKYLRFKRYKQDTRFLVSGTFVSD